MNLPNIYYIKLSKFKYKKKTENINKKKKESFFRKINRKYMKNLEFNKKQYKNVSEYFKENIKTNKT